MTSKTLLLHPGSPKGGSTWIQDFCLQNEDLFAAQDFQYVHAFRNLDFPELQGEDPSRFLDQIDALLDTETDTQDPGTVFLSYENLFGDPLIKEGMFHPAPTIARNFLPVLKRFSDTRVVWIFRPMDSFLLSVFNQRKKQGSKITFDSFGTMIEERQYTMERISDALRVLADAAEIHVMEFEMLGARPRRFIGDFFALGGVKIDRHFNFAKAQRNPSVREDGLKILEYASTLLSKSDYMKLRKFCQKTFPKTGYSADETAFIERFRTRFADSDQLFRDTVSGFATWRQMEPSNL